MSDRIYKKKQECIPVGCILPTSVAVLEGCVYTPVHTAHVHTPNLLTHIPLSTTPFCSGEYWGKKTSAQVHAGKHAPPPPVDRMSHACESSTFHFAGGKNWIKIQ